MNSREAAYNAILASARHERFASQSLADWTAPSSRDFRLAQEISYGTIRMARALDHIASQLASKKKLSLKLREKVLLRMALYQHLYMDRIPLYAITNEMVTLAKKHCHATFIKFYHAILRQLENGNTALPADYSIHYSYPAYFVDQLIAAYGSATTKEILEAGNTPPKLTARVRSNNNQMITLDEIKPSSDLYIQNATPVHLMTELAKNFTSPMRALDLCASPGGKLLLLHDLFPGTELFANDVSQEKTDRLTENCAFYGIQAVQTCCRGEEYPEGTLFDLILLDVPCSNSGVLNKRPEARWRLSPENLAQQTALQRKLLEHASKLLADDGEIWYMTCSILPQENEEIVEQADLEIRVQEKKLPSDSFDGGFGCALRRR